MADSKRHTPRSSGPGDSRSTPKVEKPDPSGRAAGREEARLLEALHAALSEDEIRRVLVEALRCLDSAGRERLFDHLGTDTGATLRSVLEPASKDRETQAPTPGKRKVQQEWRALWEDWDECIAETGHEGGKYVRQDEHWEPPWLDTSGLAEDLEKIAAEMHKLLDRVWREGLDPERSFMESMATASEEVGAGLPEWMDRGEDLCFGPEATSCLLDWEWHAARRDGRTVFALLEQVRDGERALKKASLDDGAIADFVTGLDDGAQQEVLRGWKQQHTDDRWSKALDAPHTGWFRAWRKLAERWDPNLLAALCRDNVARDWTLALPLVKGLLARKDYAQALSLIERAVAGLLGFGPGRTWDPRAELLIRHPYLRYQQEWSADVFRLLEARRKAAEGLGRTDDARALELQLMVARKRDDWDAIAAALRDAPESCGRLVADWRAEVAESSVRTTTSREGVPELGWLQALVDAVLGDADGGAFREAVRAWLREVERTPATLDQCRYSLATLTVDLDGGRQLATRCPKLLTLLTRDRGGPSGPERTRRRWIERLGGFGLFPEVVAFWKRNAGTLVPDPGRQDGSSYQRCAEWMAAILEFDRDGYAAILERWSVNHKRRRNLWQALARRGLPVGVR